MQSLLGRQTIKSVMIGVMHILGKPTTIPVVCVAWHDAKQYVKWLSDKTERNYRLLSESEWEYVARAGTKTAYHFGNRFLDKGACHLSTGTIAVGKYPENQFGLHDVHGNVWEWVEDCWHERLH